MNRRKTLKAFIVGALLVAFLPIAAPRVSADNNITCPDGTIVTVPPSADAAEHACDSHQGPPPEQDIGSGQKIYDWLTLFINVLSGIVGVVVVVSIIMGGIQYSTAGGDPQKVSAAKKRILNSVIALLAFIFMYAFLQYIVPGGVF